MPAGLLEADSMESAPYCTLHLTCAQWRNRILMGLQNGRQWYLPATGMFSEAMAATKTASP